MKNITTIAILIIAASLAGCSGAESGSSPSATRILSSPQSTNNGSTSTGVQAPAPGGSSARGPVSSPVNGGPASIPKQQGNVQASGGQYHDYPDGLVVQIDSPAKDFTNVIGSISGADVTPALQDVGTGRAIFITLYFENRSTSQIHLDRSQGWSQMYEGADHRVLSHMSDAVNRVIDKDTKWGNDEAAVVDLAPGQTSHWYEVWVVNNDQIAFGVNVTPKPGTNLAPFLFTDLPVTLQGKSL